MVSGKGPHLILDEMVNNPNLRAVSDMSNVYIGWLGYKNLGDEILFDAFRRLFPESRCLPMAPIGYGLMKGLMNRAFPPETRGEVMGSESAAQPPRTVKKARNLEQWRKASLALRKQYYRWVCGCRQVVLGGGTLIFGRQYLEPLETLMAGGFSGFAFGSGVMDDVFWADQDSAIRGDENEKQRWLQLLRKMNGVSVRGYRSQEILRQYGIGSEVVGDPALLFSPSQPWSAPRRRILGMNVGQAKGILWGGKEDRVIQTMQQAAEALQARGWTLRLFCVCQSDAAITRDFARYLGVPEDLIVEEYADAAHYINLVRECDVFVGIKLHATILAYSAHVPSVMIEYRPKCADFMESVDAADQCLRCDQMTAGDIIERVETLYDHSDEVCDKQREMSYLYARKCREFCKGVIALID